MSWPGYSNVIVALFMAFVDMVIAIIKALGRHDMPKDL
jgi:hypothetical protein